MNGNENQQAARQAHYGDGAATGYSDKGGLQIGGENRRQPEAVRFLGELEKMLSVCGSSLDTLEARLERVTRSEPPSPVGANSTSPPREVAQTQMGTTIQTLFDRAATLNHRVMQLAGRVEA